MAAHSSTKVIHAVRVGRASAHAAVIGQLAALTEAADRPPR